MLETTKFRLLTEEEKVKIATMAAAGATIHCIALQLGRSDRVIKKYLNTTPAQAEIADIKERLIVKYRNLAEVCVDRLLRKEIIETATPRDLATISGIAVDKSRLLNDESTENLSIRAIGNMPEVEIDAEISKIRERLGIIDIT